MITSIELFKIFKKNQLTFFTGIPDSTFADWMSFLAEKNGTSLTNIISCNECEAIALCAGYYLSNDRIGIAYMQNSGFGKTINPLTSLCDPEIYSIPVLLMIGWRGELGVPDAPQHSKMGKVMIPMLDELKIPYSILTSKIDDIKKIINNARDYLESNKKPYALIVRKGLIKDNKDDTTNINMNELTRESALKLCVNSFNNNEIFISSTGKISRELYEYRDELNERHEKDFHMVGSMGCAASIGLSISIQKRERKIIIFDGDGAIIMQMGVLATIGHNNPENLIHIVFDNESYESTGGQPTVSSSINLVKIALGCNYRYAKLVETKKQLMNELEKVKDLNGPLMLVIKVMNKSRKDLSRPKITLNELKNNFMKYLK